ncbi:MAG: AAA family ATPase [Patescibacteria group bacterium]|jgi:dephospho-CoA kinase
MANKIILGVTGTLSAGKDTTAEYLIKKGFAHYSLSAVLREIMTREGVPIKQPELTNFGNKLREERGHGYLVDQVKDRLIGQVVVSSIRQPGEVEALKKLGNFYLIFVDAPVEERYRRLLSRGRNDDPQSLEEFIKIENIQKTGSGGGMNLETCRTMSDFQVNNGGSFDELYQQLEEVLKKVK